MILSIGMMVKNEEMYLEKCLEALKPILETIDSELIIVDTGSTDRTVKIAQKFTNKVYFHNWNNNFSEMRNITLSYCSGEWFLYIDGDEVLENCEDIITFFKSREYKKYNTAGIYIKNLTDLDNPDSYSIFAALRLFKKDENFTFLGAIHNQPQWKKPVKYLKSTALHYGYIATDKELMDKKFQRTATILRQEIEKDPTNIYYMYQLSVSLSMHKDHVEATEQIKNTYDYLKKEEIDITKHFYVLPHLCFCYINQQRYSDAMVYAEECLSYKKDYIDAYYYLGYSQFMLHEYQESLKNMKVYIELTESYEVTDTGAIYYTVGKINDAYFYLYLMYRELKDCEKQIYYLSKIKGKKYDVGKEIVDLSIKTKMYDELMEYINNLVKEKEHGKIEELYLFIESQKLKMDTTESNELTRLFLNNATNYGKLNNIRMKYINKDSDLVESIEKLLDTIKIEKSKDYYGDLLYFLMKYKHDISILVEDVSDPTMNDFLQYVHTKYSDFCNTTIYDYIKVYGENDVFVSIRINKILCRYYLLLNKAEKKRFEEMFLIYLNVGVEYINQVYTPFILENEKCLEARNEEEGFFILMRKAKQYEGKDNKLFLQYVRKALDVYPYMKDGVELILEKIKNEADTSNYEFEQYKVQVKNIIKELISSGNLEEAKSLINEYELIVKADMEITLFKSQIALKQINDQSSVKYLM